MGHRLLVRGIRRPGAESTEPVTLQHGNRTFGSGVAEEGFATLEHPLEPGAWELVGRCGPLGRDGVELVFPIEIVPGERTDVALPSL